ncbi:MAG: FHA domain-containing protein [Reinekea sp.]
MPILMQIKNEVVQAKFSIEQKTVSIGRSTDNDIQLDDATVSSNHAWIECHPADDAQEVERYKLIDLNSTNGTFLNEKKVEETFIKHNDILRVGFVSFKFIDENQHRFEETSKVRKSWIPGVYYTKD